MVAAGPRHPTPPKKRASSTRRRRPSKTGAWPTQPRPSPTQRPSLTETQQRKRQERIEKAVEYCIPVLTDGWQAAVADRATTYVSELTWNELIRKGRRRRCKLLAQLARAVIAGKKKIHQFVGSAAAWLVSLITGDRIVQAFTRELAANIPLPHEAKIIAVVRATQVTGVLLCVLNGKDLTRCQCFIDLALDETKSMVKKILVAAISDWVGLGSLPGKEMAAA